MPSSELRNPFYEPQTYLDLLEPFAPMDEFDPSVEEYERSTREAAEQAASAMRQVTRAGLDREVWAVLEEWALVHAPEVPFIAPVCITAVRDLMRSEGVDFGVVIARVGGPRRTIQILQEGVKDEIGVQRHWFRLGDKCWRKRSRTRLIAAHLRRTRGPVPVHLIRDLTLNLRELDRLEGLVREGAARALALPVSGTEAMWTEEERDSLHELVTSLEATVSAAVAARNQQKRAERLAAHRAPPPVVAPTHCAEPGCTRGRVFFDGDGTGYCKRHGNKLGLRPKGKIT